MVCIREVQKTLKESAKRLIEDKLQEFGLGERQGFKVYRELIETPGDGVILFQGMQDHTAESIKSLEGFHRAWMEEAQSISERSLTLLRPTIRNEGSEIWASWNPNRPVDPVDRMLRGDVKPTGAVVVRANWSDNPWFPRVLDQERVDCLEQTPERYGHIWEGEYATVLEGAYYAKALTEAQLDGRICRAAPDPLIKKRAFFDIGGPTKNADAVVIWMYQIIGKELRVFDHYKAVGQEFKEHVHWLRQSRPSMPEGYADAIINLPHDGAKSDTVHRVTPQSFLQQAGFNVYVHPNQGSGAARHRIDVGRRVFPNIVFDDASTQAGREALGWYHERRDEQTGKQLGPMHDWASHDADAFGGMCIDYEMQVTTIGSVSPRRRLRGVV